MNMSNNFLKLNKREHMSEHNIDVNQPLILQLQVLYNDFCTVDNESSTFSSDSFHKSVDKYPSNLKIISGLTNLFKGMFIGFSNDQIPEELKDPGLKGCAYVTKVLNYMARTSNGDFRKDFSRMGRASIALNIELLQKAGISKDILLGVANMSTDFDQENFRIAVFNFSQLARTKVNQMQIPGMEEDSGANLFTLIVSLLIFQQSKEEGGDVLNHVQPQISNILINIDIDPRGEEVKDTIKKWMRDEQKKNPVITQQTDVNFIINQMPNDRQQVTKSSLQQPSNFNYTQFKKVI